MTALPNNHVRAAAEGLSDILSLNLVEVGASLGAAYRQEDAMQLKSFAASHAQDIRSESRFENAQKNAGDAISTLRDLVSLIKATTLSGAAIQLAEALSLVAILEDQFPKEAETYDIKKDFRALNRVLYSALDCVEIHAPQKLANVVTPEYGSPCFNPWKAPEDLMAEVDALLGKNSREGDRP